MTSNLLATNTLSSRTSVFSCACPAFLLDLNILLLRQCSRILRLCLAALNSCRRGRHLPGMRCCVDEGEGYFTVGRAGELRRDCVELRRVAECGAAQPSERQRSTGQCERSSLRYITADYGAGGDCACRNYHMEARTWEFSSPRRSQCAYPLYR